MVLSLTQEKETRIIYSNEYLIKCVNKQFVHQKAQYVCVWFKLMRLVSF